MPSINLIIFYYCGHVGGGSHAGSAKQDAYFRSVRETAFRK